eukprot:360199-Chlamydomonas_euryale.AAC.2
MQMQQTRLCAGQPTPHTSTPAASPWRTNNSSCPGACPIIMYVAPSVTAHTCASVHHTSTHLNPPHTSSRSSARPIIMYVAPSVVVRTCASAPGAPGRYAADSTWTVAPGRAMPLNTRPKARKASSQPSSGRGSLGSLLQKCGGSGVGRACGRRPRGAEEHAPEGVTTQLSRGVSGVESARMEHGGRNSGWAMALVGPWRWLGHGTGRAMALIGPWYSLGNDTDWAMALIGPWQWLGDDTGWAMALVGPWHWLGRGNSWAMTLVGPWH